jgi:hypothetical protein
MPEVSTRRSGRGWVRDSLPGGWAFNEGGSSFPHAGVNHVAMVGVGWSCLI